MTTLPESKVKVFLIISLAYEKSLLEIIFGYKFFIHEPIFNFLRQSLGHNEY